VVKRVRRRRSSVRRRLSTVTLSAATTIPLRYA
jgi:hypothetical protein